jgi:hypothetical protein
MKFIRDCLSEKDNKTYEIMRFGCAATLITYLILSIVDTFFQHKFNYQGFMLGIAAIPVSFGIGISSKKHTENS